MFSHQLFINGLYIAVGLLLLIIGFIVWRNQHINKNAKLTTKYLAISQHFFGYLLVLVTVAILHNLANIAIELPNEARAIINKLLGLIIVITLSKLALTLVDILLQQIRHNHNASKLALTSYQQVIRMVVFVVGALCSISILLNKNPLILLTSLGVATGVLGIIFKDSINGFIASIQITLNNVVRVGDWIECPSLSINGTIKEINLLSIIVSNGDNTISTFPANSLLTNAFKNWSAMQRTKARRYKQVINIDIASVKSIVLADQTLSTNVNQLRQQLQHYFTKHSQVIKSKMVVVHALAPSVNGLPIEVVFFTDQIGTADFWNLQSEIAEYMVVLLQQHELRLFQNSTSSS